MSFYNSQLTHLVRPSYSTDESAINQSPEISTEEIPRPLGNRYDEYAGTFTSMPGQTGPPCLTDFSVSEESVSNPRQLRLLCSAIALDDSSQKTTGLPIGAIWHPLAEQHPGDDPIPNLGRIPHRCTNCRAYINPHFEFRKSDNKMVCNICSSTQNLPIEYINSDSIELKRGTYEFPAPDGISQKPIPKPLYVVCIESSYYSVDSGLLYDVLNSLKSNLDYLHENASIAVMTFGSHLSFYNLKSEPYEIIVKDLDDPFLPQHLEDLAINTNANIEQAHYAIGRLLDMKFAKSKRTASVESIVHVFKNSLTSGARLIIFTTQLGMLGKNNIFRKQIIINKKEISPTKECIEFSKECNQADISVDMFVYANDLLEAYSLAMLCTYTGGDFYLHKKYNSITDSERLFYQLSRILTRNQGLQVIMRARVSNGLSLDNYVGKFAWHSPTEISVPCIDADKSLLVTLRHDYNLIEGKEYHMQCAIFYTNMHGERLIRVCNSAFKASRNLSFVYQYSDAEAVAHSYMKISASNIISTTVREVRDTINGTLIRMLYTYKKSSTGINTPYNLRMSTLFFNSMLKFPAFTIEKIDGDLRTASIHKILSLPLIQSRLLLYPMVYSLHDLELQTHEPGIVCENRVKLPSLVPCSIKKIRSDGIYLINNGEILVVLVGFDAPDTLIQSIWGLSDIEELKNSPDYWAFQDIGTDLSRRALVIVNEIRQKYPGQYLSLHFLFQGDPLLEKVLIEDSTSRELSYEEYWKRINKVIMNKFATS